MKKFQLKKSLLKEVIEVYTIQHFINLFSDESEKEERKFYEKEMDIWTENLIKKGVSIELIQMIREKSTENFDGFDGCLYDMVVSCGVELI